MATKTYEFNYGFNDAEVVFKIDADKFRDTAQQTLGFFSWDYDKDADPVDEAAKKYAMASIRSATFSNYNEYGVKKDFEEMEGFAPVDGSYGIELIRVSGYEFDEDDLEMEIK